MKTLVMTHTETDPLWQVWSQAAAYAESLPVGSDAEVAAWSRADELWQRFTDTCALYNAAVDGLARGPLAAIRAMREAAELDDYAATMDAASYRMQ